MVSIVEGEPRVEREPIRMPRHLVIIPDGNGRWALKHNLPVGEGHLRGAQQILKLADRVEQLGIEVCTFWGFSTENWSRDPKEVEKIFQITLQMLEANADEWVAKGRRFKHVGRKDRLPLELIQLITSLEERTEKNLGQTFVLALDYGGRDEIVRAIKKAEGTQIDEISFAQFLDTAGLPDPDLIIRTSGEYRTSGIYPYQGIYAEFVSSSVYFPDFDAKELDRCLKEFSKRKRRFGVRPEGPVHEPFEWLDLKAADFASFTNAILPHIERASSLLIQDWRRSRFYSHPGLQEDIDIYERLLTSGKKLRPALVAWGFENFAGESEYREGVLTAAIGYEILHNAFLIHDDIEDNAPIRRGQPSVHEEYRSRHQAKRTTMLDSAQYGRAVAFNLANLGAVKMQAVLWEIENKASRILEAQKWVRYIVEMTMLGQRRDLTEITLDELTRKRVYEIYYQKTAVYTVVGPLALGAILAGASYKELAYINSFGVNLGIAFQMVDDHLGLYGSEEVIGKPVGSDLAEAKKTLHFLEAWHRVNSNQRKWLQKVWGKQDLGEDELESVRNLVNSLGVKEYVLESAQKLALKARRLIPKITTSNRSASILEDLTNFVIQRRF